MAVTSTPVVGIDIRKLSDFGIGTYIRNLLDGFSQNPGGFRFELFMNAGQEPEVAAYPEDIFSLRILESHRRSPFQGRFPDIPLDVLHIPHYMAPVNPRIPVILTVHDLIHLHPPKVPRGYPPVSRRFLAVDILKREYHRLTARLKLLPMMRAARRIIAVSETTARSIRTAVPETADTITVIPNCVATGFFDSAASPAESELHRDLQLPSGPFFLVSGNDIYHKNIAALFPAWRILTDAFHLTPALVFIGAPRVTRTHALPAPPEIARLFYFTGRLKQHAIYALYKMAEGLVAPSLAEGFGLPVAEAMAAGIPVACSDLPVFREITGGNAAFFDPENPRDIALKIREIMLNSRLQREMVSRNTTRAELFRCEKNVEAHLRVYRKTIREIHR